MSSHFNGNLLCVVDCETTGKVAGWNDIIQVCFMPLTPLFEPHPDFPEFYKTIRPKRPENIEPEAMKVNGLNLEEVMKAPEPEVVAEEFNRWFESLKLFPGKRLLPLAQNWAFDRNFCAEWLGEDAFNNAISYHARDSATAALFLNDAYSIAKKRAPFERVNLDELCSVLKLPNEGAHDSRVDCLRAAGAYRKMLELMVSA